MIVLLGKTATGKDTVQKELIKRGMDSIVSYTTRPPRPNEIEGITYHFVTKEEFLEKEKNDFFAETTSYNIATGETWYYGCAIEDFAEDKVVILNPEGFRAIKNNYPEIRMISILLEVNEDTIRNRLLQRGDNPTEATRRLLADKKDFKNVEKEIDYVIYANNMTPDNLADLIIFLDNKLKEENL